jgi:hypothetical protein
MANVQIVAMVGDIEVDIDDSAQEENGFARTTDDAGWCIRYSPISEAGCNQAVGISFSHSPSKAGLVRRSVEFVLDDVVEGRAPTMW